MNFQPPSFLFLEIYYQQLLTRVYALGQSELAVRSVTLVRLMTDARGSEKSSVRYS